MDRVVGFSGSVSFSRSATITRSLVEPMAVYRSGQALPVEPESRRSIGVWVNNCESPTRTRIIDSLLRSGLAVESYGSCRYNMGEAGRGLVLGDDNLGTRCRKHRLMLAVENEACPILSLATRQSVRDCGAIPIIATIEVCQRRELFMIPAAQCVTARLAHPCAAHHAQRFVPPSVASPVGPQSAAPAAERTAQPPLPVAHTRAAELPAHAFQWEQCVYCEGEVQAEEREHTPHGCRGPSAALSRASGEEALAPINTTGTEANPRHARLTLELPSYKKSSEPGTILRRPKSPLYRAGPRTFCT